jgi:hypothetical protein
MYTISLSHRVQHRTTERPKGEFGCNTNNVSQKKECSGVQH